MGAGKEHQNSRRMKFRRNKRQSTQLQNVDDRTNSRVAATWRLLMLRVPPLAVSVALLLGTGFSSAQAKSALPAEDRWNPQHIDGLPAEIRSAIAPYARVCGGPLAAEHSFVRYFQSGTTKLIGFILNTSDAAIGKRFVPPLVACIRSTSQRVGDIDF
jgi:hypothetical protein